MCKVFDVPIHEYAFGKTKLFFRAGQAVGLAAFCRAPHSLAEAIVLSMSMEVPMSVFGAAPRMLVMSMRYAHNVRRSGCRSGRAVSRRP